MFITLKGVRIKSHILRENAGLTGGTNPTYTMTASLVAFRRRRGRRMRHALRNTQHYQYERLHA